MRKVEKKLSITNKFGLHGRPAARLVEVASLFASDIRLVRDGCEVNCKSILDVMSMACANGTPVTVKASGADADEAMAAVESLFTDKFGEE